MNKLLSTLAPLSLSIAALACGGAANGSFSDEAQRLSALSPDGASHAVIVRARNATEGAYELEVEGLRYDLTRFVAENGGTAEVRSAEAGNYLLTWVDGGEVSLTANDKNFYSATDELYLGEDGSGLDPLMLALIGPAFLAELEALDGGDGSSGKDDSAATASHTSALRMSTFNNCPGASCGGGAYTCCCNVGDRCVVGTGSPAECWCEPAKKSLTFLAR